MYKDIKNAGGLFLIYSPSGFLKNYLQTFKFHRIVNIVSDRKEAKAVWDAYKLEESAKLARKEALEKAALLAAQKEADEKAAQLAAAQKKAEIVAKLAAQLAEVKKTEAKPLPATAAEVPKAIQPLSAAIENRPYCFEYWSRKSPHDSTRCKDCFRKLKPSLQPCWLIEDSTDGIAIHYINESCTSCAYYLEFGFNNE
jgi:hypothetical protein